MRIRHLLPTNSSRKEVSGDRAFFMRNQAGDMLHFFTTTQTRYEGWYIHKAHQGFFKLVERIELVEDFPIEAITTISNACFWEYKNGLRAAYKLVNSSSGLTVSFSKKTTLRIVLDIRHIYQNPDFERSYALKSDSSGHLLTYTDPSLESPLFLHLRTNDSLSFKKSWQPREYPRDTARHSPPDTLFVYNFAELTTDLLAFGAGFSAEEAKKASLAAARQRPEPPAIGMNYTHDTLLNEVSTAKAMTQQSLRWLQTEQGIWAGLPWFHQIWSRDELIAALGFSHDQQREVIERYLGLPLKEGELPTYVGSGTTCADGVGWLALLVREHGLSTLSDTTRHRLLNFLQKATSELQTYRQAAHGFINSGHNATWMDTIGRQGFRLEIQCMYALVLELLFELTNDESYEQTRSSFLKKIKHEFWNHGYLYDGLNDPTIRPNLFIAYLLQPDLLSTQVWQACFEKALLALSTNWGGLSSLEKTHSDFHLETTGEDNNSYHNGDSWFFINNLVGIALIRLNQRRYGKTVVSILQSSTDEILWAHMLGHPGEISSVRQLDSYGCGIQAFSGGTYLALLKEFEDYSTGQDRDSISFFWDSTAESTADNFFK